MISRLQKTYDKWLHSSFRGRIESGYYNIKNFLYNLPFFIGQAWKFRSWDYTYSINLFCDSLERSAKISKRYARHVGSEKVYRRQMTAAGMLRQAYEGHVDPTLRYLMRKNPIVFKKRKNGAYSMGNREVTNKKIYDALWKMAHERSRRIEEERQVAAWAYLNKYIMSFWN